VSLDLTQVIRTGLASLYSVSFDCQDRPAAFVQPSYRYINGGELKALGTELDPLLVFYFDEQGIAYQSNATSDTSNPQLWTFPTGVFSSLNLPPATNLIVKTSLVVDQRGPRVRTIRDNFSTRLTAGRMATIHFYPRDYSIKKAQ